MNRLTTSLDAGGVRWAFPVTGGLYTSGDQSTMR